MERKMYPCDGEDGHCPYDAWTGEDCRTHCGYGVDEDEGDSDDDFDDEDDADFDEEIDESMNPYDGTYDYENDVEHIGGEDY